eukprot:TRINITY_DN38073_c0_g1_i1.p1 TRINITY_DN38073_c0_g1~~TRINITY_DN38073_c0_g1_i1.p1  ORF type:complete len:309 (-),score=72.78 TRINITY_DN38073_c0_g1_i1:125-1051(-)
MRSLLEASEWDLSMAQPSIDKVLKQRIALAKEVDAGDRARRALSLCDWDPNAAATLLALQLQLGYGVDRMSELQRALTLADGNCDRAEAVLKLSTEEKSLSLEQAAELLKETKSWSVPAAKRIRSVRSRFPGVSAPVALKVLRRNDDDPHAACEMLAEYRQRIKGLVVAQMEAGDIFMGEEVHVAEAALSACEWDPRTSFVAARTIAACVQRTRHILRSRAISGTSEQFQIDAVLSALTAADMKPKVAVSLLLGESLPPQTSRAENMQGRKGVHGYPKGEPPLRAAPHQQQRVQHLAADQDEEYCSVM